MSRRGVWFVGALALSGCGEVVNEGGALEGSGRGSEVETTLVDLGEPALARALVEGAIEQDAPSCEVGCRWACDAAGCDAPETVEVGAAHSCVLRESGRVDCWGENERGQLGDGTLTDRAAPMEVPGVERAVEIAAGDEHTCVRRDDGLVACWGANDRGQLGDGSTVDSTRAVFTTLEGRAVEIAAGGARTCARLTDGAIACWGEGAPDPVRVAGVSGAIDVDVGGTHACAVRDDGAVLCWGENSDGQLGDGTLDAREVAADVRGLRGMIAVRLGRAHSCAIDELTHAICWGDNEHGQLGDGTRVDRTEPSAEHSSVVTVGGNRTCGRVPFGEIACWGEGYDQETLVALLDEASVVAVGAAHGCAVHRIGTARCWGENASGQLGDGTRDDAAEPRDALPPRT